MKLNHSSRRQTGGFTLIEIMLVVALIGIMAALIVPEMKGTFQGALLRSTGRELMNAFRLAYSRSVSLNQPHRVRVNAKTGKYFVEKRVRDQGRDRFVPLRDVAGGTGSLDSRIKIEFHRVGEVPSPSPEEPASTAPEESDVSESDVLVVFYPDGTADAGIVMLQDSEGFRFGLGINPTTARIRVAELGREEVAAAGGSR